MDLIHYLKNNLITDNTKELDSSRLFLKTFQNQKYSKHIKNFITPKELLKSLNLKTKFVGITGTNGKTTTAFVLGFLLRSLGFSVAIQGTEGFYFNGEKKESKTLTTPPIFTTIKRAFEYSPDFYIMEVSSHAIVQQRIEGIEFSAKIMTSFSQDHLDFHKSMEEYKKVKESFFQDEAIKVMKGKRLSETEIEIDGYVFRVNPENLYVLEKPIVDDIPMAGEFNKMNFSLALKTASLLTNSSLSTFNFSLFKGVAGRMEIISENPYVVVDFAHTPDGMEKILQSINRRKIVLFGAGGNRDREKRAKMGEVADKYADFIILTEDNPRCEDREEICLEIAKGIKNKEYIIIPERKEALKKALEIAKKENYALLVLGKGDENYIEYCGRKIDYSDRDVIKEILKV
jgi:UDP-N-acetylmuramoyl-L-alanyl-D-glutamate--2,6-diaminopimelate ligase